MNNELPPPSTKLFQLNEDDLATLERDIPAVFDRMYDRMDNAMCVKFRRIQTILTNIRWNYGPPRNVEVIPADE